MSVDWTKPIEFTDGQPAGRFRQGNVWPDPDGQYHVADREGYLAGFFNEDGSYHSGGRGGQVRNVGSAELPTETLRDRFAMAADQPGVSELVAMAGGMTDGYNVKFSADGSEYKFNQWWNDLPLSDRLSLAARVRYAYADAMLAARGDA